MIRFSHVTLQYARGLTALRDVSLSIARREFVFLTGPSGAGKSTILRLMYMDERPTSGEVSVGGFNSTDATRGDVARLRRKLGIVFQDFRLLEDRTIEQNVAFALEVIGTPRATISSKVSRVLTQVGLGSKGTALPHELSGGEQQRAAIARALVNDPFVLIADEPTGNLDERASRGVFQLLQDINAAGTAVVMATHDLDIVERAAYRVISLEEGVITGDTPSARRGVILPGLPQSEPGVRAATEGAA